MTPDLVFRAENPANTKIITVCRVSKANDGGAGGAKAPPGARNHSLFVISLPENTRERDHVATRPTKTHRLVDSLTSEGIVNLPASIFLESLRLRRWQQFADAGAHTVRKAGKSTPCGTDRLGMTRHRRRSQSPFLPDPLPNSSAPDKSTTTAEPPRYHPSLPQHPDETSESDPMKMIRHDGKSQQVNPKSPSQSL
jgi:hypothetical protein